MDNSIKLYPPFKKKIKYLKRKYGKEMCKLNGFSDNDFNFTSFIDKFIDADTVADATIDGNANSSNHDIRTLLNDIDKPHKKLLAFNKIYYEMDKAYGRVTANQWLECEWNGTLYMHDSSTATFMPYCFAYDLEDVVQKGLFFIDKFKAQPAQHFTTFNNHTLEFVSWNANRTSGAVGLPSYLVHSFYYWKHDVENNFYLKDPEYYRRQCFQQFIYDLNQPYLRVTECAFTNVSIMDRNYLIELFGGREFPDGTFVIDYIDDIIEHQKIFMEVVSEVREEQFMTFPVLTYSLLYQDGKFVDEDFARWCCKHNMKWNDSNFFVGNDVTNLSSCCRMINDTSKIDAFINSIGGTSLSIGSVKVSTINLRRLSLISRSEAEFMENLQEVCELNMKVLHIIRHIIKRNVEKGLLPNYTHKLIDLDKQFNTIGITAMYEVINDFGYINTDEFGNKSYSKKGIKFADAIMQYINELKGEFEKTVDYSLNIEAIPAERANVVLAEKDNMLFNNHIEYDIYSNQWIPLQENCTLKEKIEVSSVLDKSCGGGVIAHINIDGEFASEEQAWKMLNYIASQGVIYFAYNTKISVCEDGHGFHGDICPKCGKPKCDEFCRIVGFLTPISTWSKTRKAEYKRRKFFAVRKAMENL